MLKELVRASPQSDACTECAMNAARVCVACTETLTVRAAKKRANEEMLSQKLRGYELRMQGLNGPFRARRKRSAAARTGVAEKDK
jgi:hypothetical protein